LTPVTLAARLNGTNKKVAMGSLNPSLLFCVLTALFLCFLIDTCINILYNVEYGIMEEIFRKGAVFLMKHTIKRTLSALLVLCLFVGLLPQIAPEQEIVAQATASTMYYNFTKANTGSYGSTAAAKLASFQALTYDAVAALNTSIASDPWAYHSYSYVSEDSTESASYSGYGYAGIGLVMVPGSRKCDMTTAVKVKVANAGKYVPYLNIHGGYFKNYAGTITVNFRALNSDGSLGTTLASKELFLSDYPEANTYVPISTKYISLSATEYALEFVIDNERTIPAFDGFQLVAADSTIVSSIYPNNDLGVYEVNVGSTINIPFTQALSDGTTTTNKLSGWNYTTGNSYVTAGVNSSSRYFTITGVAATSTPQTIFYSLGSNAKTKINVIVRPAGYTPAATDLYYDFTKVLPDSLTVNHVHNIAKFIKYNHTAVGGYGEINAWTGTASATSVFSQPWKVSSIASTVTFSPLFHNYGIQSKKQGVADIKIKVPADGVYMPQLNLFQALATPVTMSVINSSGSTLCTKTLSAGTSGTRVNFASSVISLKAGEYTVRFNKLETGSSADAGANYYDGLFFAYKGPIGTKLNMNANRNITMSVGANATTKLNLSMSNGSAVDYTNGKITVSVANTAIATATSTLNGASSQVKFTSKAAGTTSATITFTNGVFEASQTVIINSSASTKLYMSATKTALKPTDTAGSQITVKTADGAVIDNSTITFSSANTKVATVSSTGLIKPVAEGKTNINAALTYGGTTYNLYIEVKVTTGKTGSSWYTPARRTGSSSNVTKANTYLNGITDIWSIVTTQELPRGAAVGHRYDPEMFKCRYCGLDFATSQWGSYAYRLDPVNDPWKLTCPSCTREFPSNDFESFYKLGIGADGMWSYELAKSENAKLVAQGKTGYLTNTRNPEKGTGWGVDDGYGYHSGKTIVNGKGVTAEQVYTYIAYYNHWGVWHRMDANPNDGIVQRLLETLPSAYFYSKDIKYGKAAAILVDRIADVYPTLYMEPYFPLFFNSDSTQPKGKMVGSIWQHTISRNAMKAYDAVYDVYEDPTVVEAISEKAAQYNLGSAKLTTVEIRDRIDERLVLQTYKDIRSGNIHGNFGMHQSCAAYAGVIYDTLPKTKEILDWVYASSSDTYGSDDISGGNVTAQLINLVDRDGHGAESAPNYNELWGRNLSLLAEAVAGYKTYEAGDLYQNPRFVLMLKSLLPLVLVRNQVAQIGDSSAVGMKNYIIQDQFLRDGFIHTGDIEYAQFLYHKNKANPNKIASSIRQQVLNVIAEHGEYDFDKSRQLTGYGFSIIRDGTYKENADGTITDTQRDFWLYYGAANSHKHADVLNLGIEAYGVNMAPDIGYPTAADGSDKSTCWEQSTVMHNTVMTNNQSHNRIRSYTNGTPRNNGRPLHFDDSGRVKVMDVLAPPGSTNGTASGIFRRSIVMVNVNDEVSYGVDFFRVKGGNEHLYNFHAMSDEIYATEGLTLVTQSGGSYAGANIAYETKGYANGFTYLKNVRRATNCSSGSFAVDFKIKDFRNDWAQDMNLHLRINMVNGFALSEVALATGVPPQRDGNPETLEFLMARRSGSNLDSLFTAVYEPYKDSRYITSIANAKIERTGGATEGTDDVAKAVQVVRTDGITDYIVYATNNQVTYKVAGLYDFQGFVGVISVKNGSVIYAYGNDATKVHTTTSTAAYTGTVTDFTKDLAFENHIDVQFSSAIDVNKIIGKHIDIENGRTENAVFEILGATSLGSNKYRLDVGEKSLITATKDAADLSKGYIYNAAAGNTFKIALPTVVSNTTVTLDPNGGTVGTKTSVTVAYGNPMPGIDAEGYLPTRTGYRFGGFVANADGSGTQYYTMTGKSNHSWDQDEPTATIYATWNVNTYKVKYNANGGSGSMSDSSHTYDVSKALTANAFTRTGYTFAGWATSAGGAVKYTNKESVKNLSTTNQATVNLYAVWTPNTYSVKYNANGGSGSMSNSSHTYDTAKALTANAYTRTGYTFAGWATSADGAVKYADKASVKNLTATNQATVNLYAIWTPNTYSVKYNANGGSGTMSDSTHAYNEAKALTANAFTRTGYTFAGWATSANGEVAYTDGQSVSNLSGANGGAVNLYAKWTPNTYSVKYNANGGSGSMSNSSHTYDVSKALTANAFTKTGYTFAGWATSENGEVAHANNASVKNLSATNGATVNLYAVWTLNSYSVKYNANGGSGTMSDSTHAYNEAKNLTTNAYTRDGYTFAGWATSENGEVAYTDGQSVSNLSNASGATVNLYAVWTANTYNVTLDAGNSVTATYNAAMPAITPPKRAGKVFAGYFTGSNGSGAQYYKADGTSNKNWDQTEDVTLYAKWSNAIVTLTNPGDKSVIVGNELSFTLSGATNSGMDVTYSANSLPDGATLNENIFTWTPTTLQIGDHSVTFEAIDGAVSNSQTITITVNAPTSTVTLDEDGTVSATYGQEMPTITPPTKNGYIFEGYYSEVNGGGTQYYKADGSSARTWNLTGAQTLYANWIKGEVTITQIEDKIVQADEELTFTVEATSTAPGEITYSAENLPDGATFDTQTGEFNWTPSATQAGEYTITFKGSDGVSYAQVNVKVSVVTVLSEVTLDYGTGTKTINASYGEAMPKVIPPTKAGSIFSGYYDGRDGAGTKYYNADGTSARSWDKSGNATLYAYWIEGSDIFGTTGAYIRNLMVTDENGDTKYQVHIFAGIDSLNYRTVGFEVNVGGEPKIFKLTTVFGKITAQNETVYPTRLGSKCTSIFGQTLVFSEDMKDQSITYRPYAIDKNGNTVYGKYVTINKIYNK